MTPYTYESRTIIPIGMDIEELHTILRFEDDEPWDIRFWVDYIDISHSPSSKDSILCDFRILIDQEYECCDFGVHYETRYRDEYTEDVRRAAYATIDTYVSSQIWTARWGGIDGLQEIIVNNQVEIYSDFSTTHQCEFLRQYLYEVVDNYLSGKPVDMKSISVERRIMGVDIDTLPM